MENKPVEEERFVKQTSIQVITSFTLELQND